MSLITLITGGSRGIGLELVKQLSAQNHCLYPLVRGDASLLEGINLNGGTIINNIDVTKDESISNILTIIGDKKIDILINNSGLLTEESLDDLSFERIQAQFEVNAIGPLRITNGLRNNFKFGTKVVIISSRMGSIADNGSGRMYGYRMSKAAINMGATSLSKDLKSDGVIVSILHPGHVRTDMTAKYPGGIDVVESVNGLVQRINECNIENTGKFYHAITGEELPW